MKHYEQCENYTENVNKDICEWIISGNYPFADCVYKDNQCITNLKTCSSYNAEISFNNYYKIFLNLEKLIKDSCETILLDDLSKKCVFSNDDCLEKNRNCLEIYDEYGMVTQEICESALTSDSNKKCTLKEDKTGCKEIETNTNNKDSTNKGIEANINSKDSTNDTPNKKDGCKIYQSKTFIIISILFLVLWK